jgi:hypothetical protein
MNRRAVLRAVVFGAALCLAASLSALGDDSAAGIAAGGLVPRRETRIVMAKEVLRISPKKVVVDYDFRNDTGEDVTTEVAFPIPPYENDSVDGPSLDEASFQSFRLWVNGKPASYDSEAKATLKGTDVTAVLKAKGIDIPTFGHFVDTVDSKHNEVIGFPDFSRLSKGSKDQLVKAGLFEPDPYPWAKWTVHLQYHWTQTFPARSTVHIRHEYSPVEGFSQISLTAVEDFLARFAIGHSANSDPDGVKLLAGFCSDQPFLSTLARPLRKSESQAKTADDKLYDGIAFPHWVDFILTSANTWQRPIEDFTLIVERPQPEQDRKALISFCSPNNGKVGKLDADHFQVHLTSFVPTSELHIGFFEVPLTKPAQETKKK